MKWILQHSRYGLGNFVNLTPAIQAMEGRVPVYFETEYVKQAYQSWDKIKVLEERPQTSPTLSTEYVCRDNNMNDSEYIWKLAGNKGEPLPTHAPKIKVAVIMNGCATSAKRHTKNPGTEIYNHIIFTLQDKGYKCIFVGTTEDKRYSPFALNCDEILLDNIQLAMWAIQSSDLVIANATGLYHVAGAHQKKGFILWKDCLRPRNESPNPNFTISHDWKNDFDNWIEEIKP